MRKKSILVIIMALLVCMVQPAFADTQPIFEPVPADQIKYLSTNSGWDKMIATG
ncbi:MAG: hypothetical protein PHP26_01180 [Syntrophomonas sp.]|uniref:hypothetical protein n=1 Tax=Syntrophomonas sp. TaxID=2053627 RepID=UPI0026279872|nr:hypothetical protein [Syntrophomonas sp.]MDD2509866.1 hypothetical protein [Syntrophomonas sp.]MDD3878589.1 hypothetical protein [Syntrophomonas sp.]MDD4626216.1 hypothetical protein [Syntrophomonas sp.]